MLSPTTIAAVPPPDGQVRLEFSSVETVPALLDDQTKRFPDRILLITEDQDTDHTITYHQFKRSALQVGARL